MFAGMFAGLTSITGQCCYVLSSKHFGLVNASKTQPVGSSGTKPARASEINSVYIYDGTSMPARASAFNTIV